MNQETNYFTDFKHIFRELAPYGFILILLSATYFSPNFFTNNDLDQYYGTFVDQDAYDFSLRSSENTTVRLSQFKGKYVLITFGFTQCDSICPLNISRFHELWSQSKDSDLNFIFISFDRLRDNPESVGRFLSDFNISNLYGLVDGEDSGLNVAYKYKNHIKFDQEKILKNKKWQINHNGFLYLIDKNGKLAIIYMQQNLKLEKIYQDIKELESRT